MKIITAKELADKQKKPQVTYVKGKRGKEQLMRYDELLHLIIGLSAIKSDNGARWSIVDKFAAKGIAGACVSKLVGIPVQHGYIIQAHYPDAVRYRGKLTLDMLVALLYALREVTQGHNPVNFILEHIHNGLSVGLVSDVLGYNRPWLNYYVRKWRATPEDQRPTVKSLDDVYTELGLAHIREVGNASGSNKSV